jgi:hypothetical protein
MRCAAVRSWNTGPRPWSGSVSDLPDAAGARAHSRACRWRSSRSSQASEPPGRLPDPGRPRKGGCARPLRAARNPVAAQRFGLPTRARITSEPLTASPGRAPALIPAELRAAGRPGPVPPDPLPPGVHQPGTPRRGVCITPPECSTHPAPSRQRASHGRCQPLFHPKMEKTMSHGSARGRCRGQPCVPIGAGRLDCCSCPPSYPPLYP